MRRIAFILLLLGALPHPAVGGDPDPGLKEKVLRAYEPQAAKLAKFYESVRLRARYTDTMPGKAPEKFEQLYLATGRLMRLDEIGFGARNSFGRIADPDRGCFKVYHKPDELNFQLIRAADAGDYQASQEAFRSFALLPCWAYCIHGVEISEQLGFQNLRITEMTPLRDGPEPLVRVSYERVWRDGRKFPITTGWYVFAENQCWAVREASQGAPSWPDSRRWRIEYRGDKGGIPLVHKIEMWGNDEHGKRERTWVGEVTELIPEPPAPREFTLAAYGLSEAGLAPAAPRWYYLQLAAVVALAAAVVFWRLSRRRRARPE
jgi:hypothetical protein